jgi:Tfp pilus assembly protein PilN
MLSQLVSMRKKLEELQQQELVAGDLESQRNALTLLGVISDTAQKTKGRLRVTRFELTNFQNSEVPDADAAADASPGVLTLSGVSLDNPAVAELLDGLQHSGLFKLVELKTLKEREAQGGSLRDYDVRCEF